MRADEGVINLDRGFQHIGAAVEFARFAALGEIGADTGCGVERRYPCPARAAAFDKNALRHQFNFNFATDDLVFSGGGHTGAHRKRGNQFAHLFVLGQHLATQFAGCAHRVADEAEIFGTLVAQGGDQAEGESVADTEAAESDGGAVLQVSNGFGRGGKYFIHGKSVFD